MRRIIFSAAAIALAFAACTDVPVAPDTDLQPQFASGGLGVRHVAAGNGHFVFPNGTRRVFSFAAQEYNDDRPSTGHFKRQFKAAGGGRPFFVLEADVTCLSVPMVPSNEAWIAGVIRNSSDPTNIGKGAWFRVKDQGERHSDLGNDQISRVQITDVAADAQIACETNDVTGANLFGVVQGNIQVAASG